MSPTALSPAATPTTGSGSGRRRGLVRRVLDGLVVAVLGGLGALGTLIGTGLSLIGLCCAGPALAAGGVAAVGTGAAGAAGGPGTHAWPFLAAGVVLLATAALLARHQTRRNRPAASVRRTRPSGR